MLAVVLCVCFKKWICHQMSGKYILGLYGGAVIYVNPPQIHRCELHIDKTMTMQKYNIICHTNPRLSCTEIQRNTQHYSGLLKAMVAKNDFSLLPDFSSSQQTHTAPIWAETGFSLHSNAKLHGWKEVTPNLEWKWTINSKAGVLWPTLTFKGFTTSWNVSCTVALSVAFGL